MEAILNFLAESILQGSLSVWYYSERPSNFFYFPVCFGGKKDEKYAQVNFCTWKKSALGSGILVEAENEFYTNVTKWSSGREKINFASFLLNLAIISEQD